MTELYAADDDLHEMVDRICKKWGIKPLLLKSKSRSPAVVGARREIVEKAPDQPASTLAKLCGWKEQTIINYRVKRKASLPDEAAGDNAPVDDKMVTGDFVLRIDFARFPNGQRVFEALGEAALDRIRAIDAHAFVMIEDGLAEQRALNAFGDKP